MEQTVLLIRNAAPGDFGGAETYQVSLATLLQENNYRPIIVSRSAKLLQYAQAHGVATKRGWWWSRQNWSGAAVLLTPLYLLWQLVLTAWYAGLIIRTGAGVLHIQSKDDFIAATLAGRLLGRRVIWTDHMDLRYIFLNITRRFRNPVGKLVYSAAKLAHHLILISDNEQRLVTSQFKNADDLQEQIVIVKNGVPDRIADYRATPHQGIHFCLASRIVANKGIGEAVEAFRQLSQELPAADSWLDVYGDGPDFERFKQQAAPLTRIIFHGHQADAQQKVYEADVFMLPSYQEGFSIALLEATMLEKAIITTDVDSNPEIISNEKTGLLVKPHDSADLKRAMRALYDNAELRNRLAHQARLQYEQNFNLANIVKDTIIPLYRA